MTAEVGTRRPRSPYTQCKRSVGRPVYLLSLGKTFASDEAVPVRVGSSSRLRLVRV